MTDKERIERLEANQEVILKAIAELAKKIDGEQEVAAKESVSMKDASESGWI